MFDVKCQTGNKENYEKSEHGKNLTFFVGRNF